MAPFWAVYLGLQFVLWDSSLTGAKSSPVLRQRTRLCASCLVLLCLTALGCSVTPRLHQLNSSPQLHCSPWLPQLTMQSTRTSFSPCQHIWKESLWAFDDICTFPTCQMIIEISPSFACVPSNQLLLISLAAISVFQKLCFNFRRHRM